VKEAAERLPVLEHLFAVLEEVDILVKARIQSCKIKTICGMEMATIHQPRRNAIAIAIARLINLITPLPVERSSLEGAFVSLSPDIWMAKMHAGVK
jgi:hypothetical protein